MNKHKKYSILIFDSKNRGRGKKVHILYSDQLLHRIKKKKKLNKKII